MERGDVARLLGVAEADVADFEVGENVVVALRDGAKRVIAGYGVFALNDHPSNRQLRWWTEEPIARREHLKEATAANHPPAEVAAEPGEEPDSAESADEVPDGPADAVLKWVRGDPERALKAWEVEQERDRPRTTLLAQLEKVASA